MENIRMELEKLVSFTMGRDVITDEDVEAICTVRVTNKIFDMVTAIVNRQTKKGHGFVRRFTYAQGTADENSVSDSQAV